MANSATTLVHNDWNLGACEWEEEEEANKVVIHGLRLLAKEFGIYFKGNMEQFKFFEVKKL